MRIALDPVPIVLGIYAFVDGSYVEDYLISNPGEGFAVQMEPRFPNLVTPKPKRDYDAVEVHLRKRCPALKCGKKAVQPGGSLPGIIREPG